MEGSNASDDIDTNEDSKYIEYSKGILDQYNDKRRVLFFYANWCPTCRPADKEFLQKINKIPDGVVVIRINYNDSETNRDEKDLANTYNVTYQHTFVEINSSNDVVTKWNGGSLDELISRVN